MKFVTTIAYILLTILTAFSQGEDINWIFGVECGVTFEDINNPAPFKSTADNWELSASISSFSGNLEFFYSSGAFYNASNIILQNGDSINTRETFARGMIIIPFSEEIRKYHVFYIGGSINNTALYHAVVDMVANQGNGLVLEKNDKIGETHLNEGISAVIHANGRDWWLLAHEKGVHNNCTNKFVKYLIKNESITGPIFQEIGTSACYDPYPGGSVKFSNDGNKVVFTGYNRNRIIDIYDFDRCTGELSNFRVVDRLINPYSAEFSPNGRYLYATDFSQEYDSSNALYQYNLISPELYIPKVRLADLSNFHGDMQIGPDKKIYISLDKYPNSSLSVINRPDSAMCDFRIFSLSLDSDCFTISGLPNMPNYTLEKKYCETGIDTPNETTIRIHPNPANESLTVEGLRYTSLFQLFDLAGKEVLREKLALDNSMIDIKDLSSGIYIYTMCGGTKIGKIVIMK